MRSWMHTAISRRAARLSGVKRIGRRFNPDLDWHPASLTSEGAALLSTDSAAVTWVHDVFAHLKVMGAAAAAQSLFHAAGVVGDAGDGSGTTIRPS
jgi:hypothetical protein